MLRNVAIIGAAAAVVHMLAADALAVTPTDHSPRERTEITIEDLRPESSRSLTTLPHPIARKHRPVARAVKREPAAATAGAAPVSPAATAVAQTGIPAGPPPELSPQEQNAGEMAVVNGDREFLMIDKALGKIILFQDGKPVFSGSALTGASTADRLPPGILAVKFSKLTAADTKVTPAGRFTVRRGRDKIYGPLLDINEIRGKDWGIAIHQVYTGIPSEQRAVRLRSDNDADKHITFGCINVEPETIRFLMKELPHGRSTPLYILPQDSTRTAAFFASHNS